MAGTRPLTDAEQDAVQVALQRFPIRSRALVNLMLNCGHRISEMLDLNIGDVWAEGKIRPRVKLEPARLKGGRGLDRRYVKSRVVVLNAQAVAVLVEYFFHIAGSAGPIDMTVPLFVSRKGSRLSRWQANRLIRKVTEAAGIRGACAGELSSHALRKTFCTNIYRLSGHDINLTRAAMNHRNVTTTQAYLSIGQDDVEKLVHSLGNRVQTEVTKSVNVAG